LRVVVVITRVGEIEAFGRLWLLFFVSWHWWNCGSRCDPLVPLGLRQVLQSESMTVLLLLLLRFRVGTAALLGLLVPFVPHALGHALDSKTTAAFCRLGTKCNAGQFVVAFFVVSTWNRFLSQSCWAGRFRRALAILVRTDFLRLDLCCGWFSRFGKTMAPHRIIQFDVLALRLIVAVPIFVVARGRARR
jgi:hypothetical protein